MTLLAQQTIDRAVWVRRAMRVYLVTDEALCVHHSLLDVVQMAVQSGVSCVQLREKHLETGAFVERARSLRAMMHRFAPGVPLVINDRVDVACAVQADGVHVGQSDMHPQDVVRLLREMHGSVLPMVGLSVSSLEEVAVALSLVAQGVSIDYLGISPVFETQSKSDVAPSLGLDGVSRIRALTDMPLVGIGGISSLNAASVVAAGADGVAVVSAICSAEDPKCATEQLLASISV